MYAKFAYIMTTDAQRTANRRNARKSTGPKTAEGKDASAQNALRHGLAARRFIADDEGLRGFMRFAAELREALAPADAVEEQLAERIILLSWRLRRTARAERGIVDTWPSQTHHTYLFHHENGMGRMFADHDATLTALSRYEASLDRALGRAYALLDRRQARRRGEAVLAPVTVLIEGANPENADSANLLDLQAKYENCETKPILPADEAHAEDR